MRSKSVLFVFVFLFIALSARAQFWHALPSIRTSPGPIAQFSDDGKKVFYLKFEDGIGNLWSEIVLDKYGGVIAGKNPPIQITHFTDRGVARFIHLLNKPQIVFMRLTADGKDYHIYRIQDDGSGEMDLTPGADGITNEIIGASSNGYYIYYTNNSVHSDKFDVYRYDTREYTSEMAFPNDKNYVALAWTRDQNKLLLEDTTSNQYILYNIETTERTPVNDPSQREGITSAIEPANVEGHEIKITNFEENHEALAHPEDHPEGWKNFWKNDLFWIDYSLNGKYRLIQNSSSKFEERSDTGAFKRLQNNFSTFVEETKSREILILSPDTRWDGTVYPDPISFSPKETHILYSLKGKLYLYDIAKKASTEMAAIN